MDSIIGISILIFWAWLFQVLVVPRDYRAAYASIMAVVAIMAVTLVLISMHPVDWLYVADGIVLGITLMIIGANFFGAVV